MKIGSTLVKIDAIGYISDTRYVYNMYVITIQQLEITHILGIRYVYGGRHL
jgi:hypothetical protein